MSSYPKLSLPKPNFVLASVPEWLAALVQFHGHFGPWAVAGFRLGAMARETARCAGYFRLRVECQGPFEMPPRSCFLDGIQVATGATLGKRNLHWTPSEDIVVCVTNLANGQAAIARPTSELLSWLHQETMSETAPQNQIREDGIHLIAERIASAPDSLIGIVALKPADRTTP